MCARFATQQRDTSGLINHQVKSQGAHTSGESNNLVPKVSHLTAWGERGNLRWLWTPPTEFFLTLPKVAPNHAYHKHGYKPLKLQLRVFLAGHTVAMATNYVMERTTMWSPIIGQCFDTMIVASSDKQWLQWPIGILAGADPGEVKRVNFHPPFSEPPSFSFFFLALKYWLVLIHYYKNSPPISKSWIRA